MNGAAGAAARYDAMSFRDVSNRASEFVDFREGEIQEDGLRLGELKLEGLLRLQRENHDWHRLELLHLVALTAMSTKFNTLCATRWRRNRRRGNTVDVLLELHSQALGVTDDVLALLMEGRFAGALARWRTLYELSVVCEFLSSASDLASRMYKASHVAERWKHLSDYETYLRALPDDGWTDVDVELLRLDAARKRIKPKYDALLEQYGTAITRNYGWALPDMDSKSTTFRELVGVTLGFGDSGWMQYANASRHVHGVRTSSMLTLSRATGPTGPRFAPAPQVAERTYVHTARTMQRINDVLARTLADVTPEAPQIQFFSEVCALVALDVQTEAHRGGSELSPGYLDQSFGLL